MPASKTPGFRLDAPLRLARLRRGELRRELALRLRELAEIEARVASHTDSKRQIETELLARSAEGITGAEIARLTWSRESMLARLTSLSQQLGQAVERESGVKDDLSAVNRQVQVLERLRADARIKELKRRIDIEEREIHEISVRRRELKGIAVTGSRSERR